MLELKRTADNVGTINRILEANICLLGKEGVIANQARLSSWQLQGHSLPTCVNYLISLGCHPHTINLISKKLLM